MSRIRAIHVERGLSLIEILVALAIGSVLVLGLVEVFAASRAAYQLSTGLARVQENGRFAMDFLQRDLRMAGHLGCVNDQARFLSSTRLPLAMTFVPGTAPSNYAAAPSPLRFDFGMRGYEATNSAPGNSRTLTTTPVLASAANGWNPAIDPVIFADMTAGTFGKPIAGSDVVELRFLLPSGAQMGAYDAAAGTLSFPTQGQRLIEGDDNPHLFGVADCMNAAVFHGVLTPNSTSPTGVTVAAGGVNQSVLSGMQPFVAGQARIHRAESIVYYIGLNANSAPSLYRLRYSTNAAGALRANREEMVEGIETLQLRYGQDSRTAETETPTGNIGSSVVASDIQPNASTPAAWRRVGMVQVGMVARSAEPAAAEQRDGSTAPLSALGLVLVPPNDTYYRAVYEDTIALRNRLFGN